MLTFSCGLEIAAGTTRHTRETGFPNRLPWKAGASFWRSHEGAENVRVKIAQAPEPGALCIFVPRVFLMRKWSVSLFPLTSPRLVKPMEKANQDSLGASVDDDKYMILSILRLSD